jgi:hypothetical protein
MNHPRRLAWLEADHLAAVLDRAAARVARHQDDPAVKAALARVSQAIKRSPLTAARSAKGRFRRRSMHFARKSWSILSAPDGARTTPSPSRHGRSRPSVGRRG